MVESLWLGGRLVLAGGVGSYSAITVGHPDRTGCQRCDAGLKSDSQMFTVI